MVISPAAAYPVLATAGQQCPDWLSPAPPDTTSANESFDFAGPAVIDVLDDAGTVTSGILAVVIVTAVVFEVRLRLRQA